VCIFQRSKVSQSVSQSVYLVVSYIGGPPVPYNYETSVKGQRSFFLEKTGEFGSFVRRRLSTLGPCEVSYKQTNKVTAL
jgi:hypothetical protein